MRKKDFLGVLLMLFLGLQTYSQVSGSFVVQGDFDKFYPVIFKDGAWYSNVPTELKIGRSNVHEDSMWRGSLMADFQFHVTAYGHGANFIRAKIDSSVITFIGGWRDATTSGDCTCIIIWLRGGNTTYHYQSNYAVNQVVYDGVQNSLPYNEMNGPAHSFKTTPDNYISTTANHGDSNYFMANVGIGTTTPDEKLTVKGKIHTQEVKVDMLGPLVPDYVFANDYKLKSLQEVEAYIKQNNHLPEIPSAQEIEKNGLLLAEMNMSLLKKIEEMTLYMIEQEKRTEKLIRYITEQNERINILEKKK